MEIKDLLDQIEAQAEAIKALSEKLEALTTKAPQTSVTTAPPTAKDIIVKIGKDTYKCIRPTFSLLPKPGENPRFVNLHDKSDKELQEAFKEFPGAFIQI